MMRFCQFAFILLFAVLAAVGNLSAQPPSDLYLFSLAREGTNYFIYHPQLLSGFNPGGYTNQPWFTPDGDILVSVRFTSESQNDIFSLSPQNLTIHRVTQTSANEYSPRFDPTQQYLSVVRQVVGDSMDQQVFVAGLGGGVFKSITPNRKDVGYYTWLDDQHLALFRIDGETNRLERYNLTDQKSRKITSAVGRSLWTASNGAVLYVHKFSTDYWYLKAYDADAFTMNIIAQTPGMSEDFAVAPDGTYFMCDGTTLVRYHPDYDAGWHRVADLSVYGIEAATRIAISPDGTKLAVVASKSNP